MLRLHLWTVLRPPLNLETGKVRARPLRALLVTYTLFGGLTAAGVGRYADLRSALIVSFSGGIGMLVLSILPPTGDDLRRTVEVLYARPINGWSRAVAQTAARLLLTAIMCACLGAPPIVAACATFGQPLVLAPLLLVLMILSGTVLSGLSLNGMLALGRWWPLDRVRRWGQLTCLLGFVGWSFVLAVTRVRLSPVALNSPAFRALPPVWFLDAVLAPFDLAGNLERALAAGCVVLLAALLAARSRPQVQAALMLEVLEGTTRKGGSPWLVRLLRAVARRPRASRLLGRQAVGVAALVMSSRAHEAPRLFGIQILLLFSAGVGLLVPAVGASLPTEGFGAIIILEAARGAREALDPAPAWVFRSAPLAPREVLKGMRLAVLLGAFWLPFGVTAALGLVQEPPLRALAMSGAYALEGHLMFSLSTVLDPAWPLSRQPEAGLPLRLVALIAASALAGVRRELMRSPGAGLVYLASLAVAVVAARAWSERRFAQSA